MCKTSADKTNKPSQPLEKQRISLKVGHFGVRDQKGNISVCEAKVVKKVCAGGNISVCR